MSNRNFAARFLAVTLLVWGLCSAALAATFDAVRINATPSFSVADMGGGSVGFLLGSETEIAQFVVPAIPGPNGPASLTSTGTGGTVEGFVLGDGTGPLLAGALLDTLKTGSSVQFLFDSVPNLGASALLPDFIVLTLDLAVPLGPALAPVPTTRVEISSATGSPPIIPLPLPGVLLMTGFGAQWFILRRRRGSPRMTA